MLEYSKIILNKVSFDSWLFEKELKKSITYLVPDETKELLTWLNLHYAEYSDLINSVQEWIAK